MLIGRGFHQLFQLAKSYGIVDELGKIIKKKENSIHKAHQIMKTLFKGFVQGNRIYHLQLGKNRANISTYYRDLRRCDENSYKMTKDIMERFYQIVGKRKSIVITIDGTFIGVRGKKYENAHKMYSGNKKDKGKKGYTIVTCFDSTNKMPITFECPNIHEIHAFPKLLEKVKKLEGIRIKLMVLDALYFNKEILDEVSNYNFIMRVPSYEWLIKYIDKEMEEGCKEIELWTHKVVLYWKYSKESKGYKLLITNTKSNKAWWRYGHYKQMVENYHNDLKNKFGIRKLPSQKFHAILVYFALILLIYMLTRALLLNLGMNSLSCGIVITVAYISFSKNEFMENLFKLHRKKRR